MKKLLCSVLTSQVSEKGYSTATSLLGIRDDLKCSVNRNDASLLVFSDSSKVSDNVRFTAALRKRHRLCFFFRKFLKCMISYLSGRRVSCKLTMSLNFARVIFDLPQRYILGPVIFSLYVADFQDGVMYKSFQYADQRGCLV